MSGDFEDILVSNVEGMDLEEVEEKVNNEDQEIDILSIQGLVSLVIVESSTKFVIKVNLSLQYYCIYDVQHDHNAKNMIEINQFPIFRTQE